MQRIIFEGIDSAAEAARKAAERRQERKRVKALAKPGSEIKAITGPCDVTREIEKIKAAGHVVLLVEYWPGHGKTATMTKITYR